jgi:chromosome segregation ATPase
MSAYLLIGLAVVLFIAGVVLLLKGSSVEELKVEPISNPKEITEFKGVFTAPRETVAVPDELKLKQELESRAELQLKKMAERDNAQQQKMNELESENVRLNDRLAEQKVKFLDLEQRYAQLDGRLSEAGLAAAQSRLERDELSARIKEGDGLLAALHQQTRTAQQAHEDKVAEADRVIGELKPQKSDVSRAELLLVNDKLTAAMAALETLKRENQDLTERNANLERNFKQVEEFNLHLREKERMLQYELTKARAQSLGLEKICEGFKVQIETMSAASSVG